MTAPSVGKFVDVELLVRTWLAGQVTGPRVVTRLPDDITGDLIHVAFAGGTPGPENSLLRVDVASFRRGGEAAAMPLAQQAHDAMRALAGQLVDGQLVNEVRVWAWPAPLFWTQAIDRVIATYELDLPVAP